MCYVINYFESVYACLQLVVRFLQEMIAESIA